MLTVDLSLEDAVDGACYEALFSMFGDLPSFQKVDDFLEESMLDIDSVAVSITASAPGTLDDIDIIVSLEGESDGAGFAGAPSDDSSFFRSGEDNNGNLGGLSFSFGRKICKNVISVFQKDGFDTLGRASPGYNYEIKNRDMFFCRCLEGFHRILFHCMLLDMISINSS